MIGTKLGQCLIGAAAASISLLAAAATTTTEADRQTPLILSAKQSTVSGQLWRFDIAHDSKALNTVLGLVEQNGLDIWQVTNSHVDVYKPMSTSAALPDALQAFARSEPRNITESPRRQYGADGDTDWNLPSLHNSTFHDHYHPMFELESFMRDLQALHPDLVTLKNLGHTGQGREMFGVSISKREETAEGDKKGRRGRKGRKGFRQQQEKLGFVIIGAQHAREWIATSSAVYLAHALVANGTEEYSLNHLLDVFDFHIVPAPNPDGYDYTWESDRYWYKNRQQMGPKGRCFGVDMNRNWGYKWKPRPEHTDLQHDRKAAHDDVDPCSDFYPGHRAFEAPEVNNIANWVTTVQGAVAFLDLRSYGQMLSTPYSYSCDHLPNDAEDQIEAALGAVQAMRKAHGVVYTTGRLCEMLYHAPGNVVDWMYKRAGIKYSYVLHLRDTGTYGFVLPPEWIRPVGEETGGMVKYLAQFIARQYNRPL